MSSKKVAILGDGKIASDCLSAVTRRPDMQLCAYVYHRHNNWSTRTVQALKETTVIACDNVNEQRVVHTLTEFSPDIIVNVNSFDILRDAILNIASDGAVNFHNGPLPSYRGMNIPTWAIFNGEHEHGVTWHLVEREIDAGAILTQERFAIESSETAISLIFKCLAAGLRQFEKLLDDYAATGVLIGKPQVGESKYYRSSDIPNDGYIDFEWPREQLSHFVRSLTFRPFPESRLRMRLRIGEEVVYVGNIVLMEPVSTMATPGTVIAVSPGHLILATKDSTIRAEDLVNTDGEPLAASLLPVKPGQILVCTSS